MIDLYYWTTPNGHKITIFLEESTVPYQIIPVKLSEGEQHKPEFLAISPNNKIPAIVDHEPKEGGAPLAVFESGAVLLYLAEKTGKLLPTSVRERIEVIEWLFWQVAGLGPSAGLRNSFARSGSEAVEHFDKELRRLYGVLDRRLQGRDYISGSYSIADVAIFTWVVPHEAQGLDLGEFPNVRHWFERVMGRPAVLRAYEIARSFQSGDARGREAKPEPAPSP